MPKTIIDTLPHIPTARAVIPSGQDPANPLGLKDNFDRIVEVLNGRLQEPEGSIPHGAVIYYNADTGLWVGLAPGASGHVLQVSGGQPAWGQVTDQQMDYRAVQNNLTFWMLR